MADPLKERAADPACSELASAFAAWITHVVLPDIGITDVPMSDSPREALEMLERGHVTWADKMQAKRLVAMLPWQATMYFGGGLAKRLEGRLEGITNTDRLADVGERIIVCESGEALLAEIRNP